MKNESVESYIVYFDKLEEKESRKQKRLRPKAKGAKKQRYRAYLNNLQRRPL
jgi:hypothetical protein